MVGANIVDYFNSKEFEKFFKKYDLNHEKIYTQTRKIVSDMVFFRELIDRIKTSEYDYCLKLNDNDGFFRNLDERYGYHEFNLRNEDNVFKMISTKEIITKSKTMARKT